MTEKSINAISDADSDGIYEDYNGVYEQYNSQVINKDHEKKDHSTLQITENNERTRETSEEIYEKYEPKYATYAKDTLSIRQNTMRIILEKKWLIIAFIIVFMIGGIVIGIVSSGTKDTTTSPTNPSSSTSTISTSMTTKTAEIFLTSESNTSL